MINPDTLKVTAESFKLGYSPLVELFELDATALGLSSPLYYHNYRVTSNAPVWFNGIQYSPFPIEVKGFEFRTTGDLTRPTMRVANVASLFTTLCMMYGDLAGMKVTRRRTFARYLDKLITNPFPNLVSYGRLSMILGSTSSFGVLSDGQIPPTDLTPTVVGSDNMFSISTELGRYYTLVATDTDTTVTNLVSFRGADSYIFNYTDAGKAASGRTYQLSSVTSYGTLNPDTLDNAEANPSAQYPPDIFFVDRKVSETRQSVEFELGISLDIEGVRLPLRTINANNCAFLYRGAECGFAENNVIANEKDEDLSDLMTSFKGEWNAATVYSAGDAVSITSDYNKTLYVAEPYDGKNFSGISTRPPNTSFWIQDVCSHAFSGCKLRFDKDNTNAALPFGGFPGTANLNA